MNKKKYFLDFINVTAFFSKQKKYINTVNNFRSYKIFDIRHCVFLVLMYCFVFSSVFATPSSDEEESNTIKKEKSSVQKKPSSNSSRKAKPSPPRSIATFFSQSKKASTAVKKPFSASIQNVIPQHDDVTILDKVLLKQNANSCFEDDENEVFSDDPEESSADLKAKKSPKLKVVPKQSTPVVSALTTSPTPRKKHQNTPTKRASPDFLKNSTLQQHQKIRKIKKNSPQINHLGEAAKLSSKKEQKVNNFDRVNLSIYLLKKPNKNQEIPNHMKEFPEALQAFPWQFINEGKYPLIGAEEDRDSFIDAQVYTKNDDQSEIIYVFQETGIRQTEWVTTLHSQIKKHKMIEQTRNVVFKTNQYKEPKGAVVFIKKIIEEKDRFFALTLGTTGRFILNLDQCVTSFGKHYAYNVLTSNPSYNPHSFTEINLDEKKLKHEQAKIHGKVEVVRGVRAFIPKAMTVSDGKRAICSFSGAHICVKEEFNFENIGKKCQEWLQTSQKKDYEVQYPHIDYFKPLEKEEEINKIFIKSFGDFYVSPPFDIQGGYGFLQIISTFELNSKYRWNYYRPLEKKYNDFKKLANDFIIFLKNQPSQNPKIPCILKLLKNLRIIGKDDNNRTTSNWKANEIISSIVEYKKNTYWIEGGEVFNVNKNFIQLVNEKVDKLFLSRSDIKISGKMPCLQLLTSFKDTDKQNRKDTQVSSETAYNRRIAAKNPHNFCLFDCKNIMIEEDPHPQSKVEPCDLLSREGDLIQLKKWNQTSSDISYMVSQSLNSAKLLIEDEQYLEKFVKGIPRSFKGLAEKLKEHKVRIVMAFIHKNDEITPSGLPINAKMDLYRGLLEIEKMGLESAIVSIYDERTPSSKDKKTTHTPSSSKLSSTEQSPITQEDVNIFFFKKRSSSTPDLKQNEENIEGSPDIYLPSLSEDFFFQNSEEDEYDEKENNSFKKNSKAVSSQTSAIIFPPVKVEESDTDLSIRQESIKLAENQGKVGPRAIPGWRLHDVEDKGNCFYDAVAHQMQIIKHPFLNEIPPSTLPRDGLRLRIQGGNFKDEEWAEDEQIDDCVKKFDIILAIVDTRTPENGYTYYYVGEDGEVITHTQYDRSLLPNKSIVRLAATGNHYLSVVSDPFLGQDN